MIDFITGILDKIAAFISAENPAGLLAIAGLAVLADIGLPVPVVVEPALFLISYKSGPLSVPVFLFIGALHGGRQIGTALLYWLSRFLGDRFLSWLCGLGRIGARISDRTEKVKKRIEGNKRVRVLIVQTITIGRLTPGLLPLVTVGAGILKISYLFMAIAVVISGLVYDLVIVFLGYLARIGLKNIDPHMATLMVLAIMVLIILLPFLITLLRRKKNPA